MRHSRQRCLLHNYVIHGKMSIIPKFVVFKRDGKLHIQNKEMYNKWIGKLSDGPLEMIIRKPISKRTNSMNAYLWGVVYKLISEETGYEDDQVHQLMKQNFGLREEMQMGRENSIVPKSTTKYTIEEMSEYWREITQWAAEFLKLQIPEPNEIEY